MTRQGDTYSIDHSLQELEGQLDPRNFFRINRQMIIHIQSIQSVHKHFKGRLKVMLTSTSEAVYVASRRVSAFQEWLDQ